MSQRFEIAAARKLVFWISRWMSRKGAEQVMILDSLRGPLEVLLALSWTEKETK